ncbi:MAG: hypothetical protein ACOYB0_09710 [Polynucleobacter sp.]
MATIEDAINTWILTQSSITAYVGTNIFHCALTPAEQGCQTDYIRYQMVIPSNEPYAFADTNTAQPMFQFDIFSKNDANCIAIGNLLATALNRFSGTLATGLTVIHSIAAGPMVRRDSSDDEWFMGVVEWTPEYER